MVYPFYRSTLITSLYAILTLRKHFADETFVTGCGVSDDPTPLGVKLSLGIRLSFPAQHLANTPTSQRS